MLHKNIFHKYCIDWLANIGHIPKNEFIFCSFYSFAENSELLAFSLFPSALNIYLKKREKEKKEWNHLDKVKKTHREKNKRYMTVDGNQSWSHIVMQKCIQCSHCRLGLCIAHCTVIVYWEWRVFFFSGNHFMLQLHILKPDKRWCAQTQLANAAKQTPNVEK